MNELDMKKGEIIYKEILTFDVDGKLYSLIESKEYHDNGYWSARLSYKDIEKFDKFSKDVPFTLYGLLKPAWYNFMIKDYFMDYNQHIKVQLGINLLKNYIRNL